MTSKAYSYIRFSSPEQGKGRSLLRQKEACEKYCLENGLSLAREKEYVFLDAGRSGFKGEHVGDKGQLARFLALVESGDIEKGSTLIVESLDRLSRQDVWQALAQFMGLLNAGINVVTLSDGQRYQAGEVDDRALIMSIFIMSRAHEESSTKAKRVRDAMRKKHQLARSEGRPMGAMAPLWLKLENGRYECMSDRVQVIRRIFDLTVNGRGKGAIAKILNEDGVPSFKGKTWGGSSIDKVLKNQAVLGHYTPRSIQNSEDGKPEALPVIKDYYPRIIEDSIFYAAMNASAGRLKAGSTKQTEDFNVWQGIAKCSLCGTAMHLIDKGKPPKGRKYLHCYQARKGLCKGKLVRLDTMELVVRAVLYRLNALSLVKDSGKRLAKRLSAVEGRLSEEQVAYEELKALLRTKRSTALADMVADAEAKISQLTEEADHLKGEIAAEEGLAFSEFMPRLQIHLQEFAGRERANALMHRLGITVLVGPEGYEVRQEGRALFIVAIQSGVAGYLERRGKSKLPLFIPCTEGGVSGEEEDKAQARYDALESEGHPAGEY